MATDPVPQATRPEQSLSLPHPGDDTESDRESSIVNAEGNEVSDQTCEQEAVSRTTIEIMAENAVLHKNDPAPTGLSIRDLHTEEGSDADIALQAILTPEIPKNRRLSVTSSNKGDKTPEGNEITATHQQYHLSYGMMLGIRVTLGRRSRQETVESNVEKPLAQEDFDQMTKITFPPAGSNHLPNPTPPHRLPTSFKFKDYAPKAFRAIRKHFGVDESDYMLSLCGDFNYIEFLSNSKSGQFFFYSHDGKYMIKTQTKAEGQFLRKILPSYYDHIKSNPSSLMTRFLGSHRVKMKHIDRKMRFVVMSSVFYTPLRIHRMFDLKGSTIGREATQAEREANKVMKDNDLEKDGVVMKLGPKYQPKFLAVLKEDSEWLASHNIMDYSLLLGIHYENSPDDRFFHRTSSVPPRPLSGGQPAHRPSLSATPDVNIFVMDQGGIRGRTASADENELYFMGIIDILQQYNMRKTAENFFKGFKHDRKQISAVHPSWYAQRFVEFMKKNSS